MKFFTVLLLVVILGLNQATAKSIANEFSADQRSGKDELNGDLNPLFEDGQANIKADAPETSSLSKVSRFKQSSLKFKF